MLRALIVDDEPLARSELRYLLETIGEIKIIGEASNAEEALELMENLRYDIVFLDIRMPGLSGTELVRKISEKKIKPYIVFVTAYSEHAVEAFEIEADDYLVKPVSQERLEKAVLRAINKLEKKEKEEIVDMKKLGKIFVDKQGSKIPIDIEEICYFEALDDYSKLHTRNSTYLTNYTLKVLEEKLKNHGFMRVHRKYLVNLKAVKEVVQLSRSAYLLKLSDERGSEIPVSRRNISNLKRVFEI